MRASSAAVSSPCSARKLVHLMQRKASPRPLFFHRLVIPGALALVFLGPRVHADTADWKAPATAVHQPNPVPTSARAVAAGHKLFTANCVSCHGDTGKGDGPAGGALDKKPADLGARIRSTGETDGELFWKISEGRAPMVAWKGSLSAIQRWELVDYIQTFAGK